MFSWGAYLAASAALVFMLASPMSGVTTYSHATEASRTLDGIANVFDALRPGLSATVSFVPAVPGDAVTLGGHRIAYANPGFELFRTSRWGLPNVSLVPGLSYQVRLDNGTLKVTPDG